MSQTNLQVLIVDDSEDDMLLLSRALRRASYKPQLVRVDTAVAMRAALDKQQFDVVFVDHAMPQFDDLAALDVLRERALFLPVIILSGGIPEHEVVRAIRSGAHDFVAKQDMSQIGTVVERVFREVAGVQERRRAELALRESEERYALAVVASRDGIWDFNLVTGYVYYSPRFIEMLGYSEAEFPPRIASFCDAIIEEDRDRFNQALKDHWERHAPFDLEVRLLTRAAETRWFCARGQSLWQPSGAAMRTAGSLSDLTQRKLYEASLREKLDIIARQQEAIQVLSTPIIEVWAGVLTIPVLSAIDVSRAAAMIETVLEAVVRTRCHHIILDLTGVQLVDGHTADHLVRLIRAVQLLGAQAIVVGIHPAVAQALVSIGIDLSFIHTMANLREALVMLMKPKAEQKGPGPRLKKDGKDGKVGKAGERG